MLLATRRREPLLCPLPPVSLCNGTFTHCCCFISIKRSPHVSCQNRLCIIAASWGNLHILCCARTGSGRALLPARRLLRLLCLRLHGLAHLLSHRQEVASVQEVCG